MFSFRKIEPMTKIKEIVKDSYAKKLESANEQKGSCCDSEESSGEASCCESLQPKLRLKSDIPSFGCIYDLPGKADLKAGEIVVDFGSGPGHDLIRAAELVGETGKAIGIDMTEAMIENATKEIQKKDLNNNVVINIAPNRAILQLFSGAKGLRENIPKIDTSRNKKRRTR